MITSLTELLERFYACDDSRAWVKSLPTGTTIEQAWYQCKRGDWMLFIAAKLCVDRQLLVLSACGCARLALPYVAAGETRPLAAIETAEAWCRGEATVEQVKQASAAAYVAAAAARATYAAANAAARAADAVADTAQCPRTAAARAETLARCADIVRNHIPWTAVDAAIDASPEGGAA